MATILERTESIVRELTDHKDTLYGNGSSVGVKAMVQKLTDDLDHRPDAAQMQTLLSEHTAQKGLCCRVPSFWNRVASSIVSTVGSAMLLAVLFWAMGMFKGH